MVIHLEVRLPLVTDSAHTNLACLVHPGVIVLRVLWPHTWSSLWSEVSHLVVLRI